MKSMCVERWLVIASIMMAGALAAYCAEVELEGDAEVAVKSAFVWRGEVINDEPVISPYVGLHASGWKLSVLGSWDLTSVENSADDSRVDATLEYFAERNRQLFSFGSVAYINHDDGSGENGDTFEAFFSYRVDVPTLPSLTVYYDFGEIDGFYATFSLAHSFPLVAERLALDLGTAVGAADKDYAAGVFTLSEDSSRGFDGFTPDAASFVDLNVTADLPIELGEQFTLMPGVKYMRVIDSDIRDALDASGLDYEKYMWIIRGTYYF